MKRSVLALLLAAAAVLVLPGCGLLSTEKDETVGWSPQKLYGEAKDAMASKSWERAIKYLDMDYFMSSVAYMAILAAMEGFKEIHLYGINLAIGDEYFYEKPNAEFILGYLRGKGLKIYVPQASALLKQHKRYGYHTDARPNQSFKVLLNARIQEYKARAEKAQAEFNTVVGAMRESEALIQVAEGLDHGADIVLVG